MHIRGKLHNPENAEVVKELCALCDKHDMLRLPDASHKKVVMRSNKDGKVIQEGSLTHETVDTVLASKCQWYELLMGASQNLQQTGQQSHKIATFGIGDCVPTLPFDQANLKTSKLDILSYIQGHGTAAPFAETKSSYQYPADAVALIGAACRLPGANNLEELWNLVSTGESRAEEVPLGRMNIPGSFRASQDSKWASKAKFYGNFIDGADCFDNAFFGVNPREAISMDPQQRVLLETAVQAMESSGYLRSHRREAGDPVGCFIGASFVEYLDNTCANPPNAYTSTGTIRAFLCGKVSYHFGWTGPSEVLDTACSSSLVAIHRACKAIQTDECPMALAGGVNILAGINNFMDLGKAGFLSPTGQCKPFDSAADGYCRGEGAGLVVLKRLSQAIEDHDHVLAVIPGAATNQGGLSPSITVPSSPAQTSLYHDILRQAGMKPAQVSYVEAHGTGTPVGDPLEVASIAKVFGVSQRDDPINLGSIKGNMGHLEVAAGVAGLLKSLVMINKGRIPPLASHKSVNPKLGDLAANGLVIASSMETWRKKFRAVMINSYGAAGSNAAVLLCQGPQGGTEAPRISINGRQTYPIILSAASKESLLMNAASLERYLTAADPTPVFSDVAFTLAEKRARHKFCWTTTESDIGNLCQALKTIHDCFEVPKEPRRVVLAFSGQNKQTVGLERSLYESSPSLKLYVDRCNDVMRQLGFSAILPAMFEIEPVTDIVSLQCGTFALQYACARSWIDSGLHVDAVVGHSFGELTALVVSDVLSLEDGLQLIATRARLMETKWGSERGTMLAVHCIENIVREAVDSLTTDYDNIEIACYNAHASQVVVGSDASITAMEQTLKNDSRFRGVQSQRLAVTHGFHSCFTQDIIEDLTAVANSLTFKRPSLQLETCTQQQTDHITPDHISRHTRQPVYFKDAIHRIEQRLGECLWLEAGINSPIIAMAKRAAENPHKHVFEGVKLKAGADPSSVLSSITVDLWREGHPLNSWEFQLPDRNCLKQVWLPPYQFERKQHWMSFTDHAMEIQKNQRTVEDLRSGLERDTNTLKLVSMPSSDSKNEFPINLSNNRFNEIVSGHAVLGRPLCPASMYMECAVMAAQLAVGTVENQALWFEDLNFEAPLGVGKDRKGVISLERDGQMLAWSFVARSAAEANSKTRYTSHAKGKFGFTKDSHFQRYQRLVSNRMGQFMDDQNAESLRKKRAYGLFSRIVSYASLLRGINFITMGKFEAVANIEVPAPDKTASESTATKLCDAISLDTFIQVVGLLINSSDQCGSDEAFLATGIGSFSMSLDCDFNICRSWTVYAMFTTISEGKSSGDVYVFTPEDKMTVAIVGVQFTKLPLAKVEKMLDGPNQKAPQPERPKAALNKSPPHRPELQSPTDSSEYLLLDSGSQTSLEDDPNDFESNDSPLDKLKTLIASYVGLSEEDLVAEASMAELGVDSLAATELADELDSQLATQIDGGDLVGMSFGELCETVAPKKSATGPKIAPTVLSLQSESKKEGKTDSVDKTTPHEAGKTALDKDPVDAIPQCVANFDILAESWGFNDYWREVAPNQDRLVLAYVAETLRKLGVNLWKLPAGEVIPRPQCLPKHSRLLQRLWDMLERLQVTSQEGSKIVRSSNSISDTPSSTILEELNARHPQYANEHRLMAVTGPHLADCLTGKADPVDLLFGGSYGQRCLDDFYTDSPQLATSTDLLLDLITAVMDGKSRGTISILEVGGGFGGTTTKLAKTLEGLGRPVEYTFTDISSLLVRKAREKFSQYAWMNFQTLNLETGPNPALYNKYDIVLGTNVVHATASVVNSSRHIKSLLKEGGCMILSEVTKIIDWYDLVYGPLDGWWCMKDGRSYPLQSSEYWMEAFREAGFTASVASKGRSLESQTQQLLIGSTR